MFRTLLSSTFLSLFLITTLWAQSPGDTIIVKALDYSSASRDTLVEFPTDPSLTFEKIILKYNMRCKDGLVSTGSNTNLGCGEWDYSCNTFIVDSSKLEILEASHPKYIFYNNDVPVFKYTTQPVYDYYQYSVDNLVVTPSEENEYVLADQDTSIADFFDGESFSGKMVYIYTAEELTNAGFSAGEIDGFKFNTSTPGIGNFLSVEIAESSSISLTADMIGDLNFQQLSFENRSFSEGENSIYFFENFTWDGTSSLVFSLSYTNSGAYNAFEIEGVKSDDNSCFLTHNNYSIDLSNNAKVDIVTDAFESIEKELTISMWLYGDPDNLPANTSVLYGYDTNPANRDINIHLPWSNSNIYFDCGFAGGSYDRINKLANKADFSGQWSYWTFTKNASSGSMKIYLNGNLWHSGTGLSRDVNLMHLILGQNQSGTNNYKGNISDLKVWNTELSAGEISDNMHVQITNAHPKYNNLVAYYPMTSGEGLTINNVVSGDVSQGKNIAWNRTRGENLFKDYRSIPMKPAITLLQGTYTKDLIEETVLDSVKRNPVVVEEFEVVSHDGEAISDELVVVNTQFLYDTEAAKIYDAETSVVLNSIAIVAEDSIVNEDLAYFNRFPFYNEIMSFVTPYGINLDLGDDGKSWYYDMSDFAPILRGNKRLLMTMGGQYQEDMNLEFYFIVGTPPHEVLKYDQLWQGVARGSHANINSILTDTKLAPVEISTPLESESFKIKSTITGHGAEGEFHQLGGVVVHMLTFADAEEEIDWIITQECSENPVYPQGGTWVYDRQGWCPGERSLTTEHDLDDVLVPGMTEIVDYSVSNPGVSGGDYRYLTSHQLVCYGPANFNNDAAIIDVIIPSTNVLHSRLNPACDQPKIIIRNTGSETLTSLRIEYGINNAVTQEFNWSGNLEFMESEEVELPVGTLFDYLETDNNLFYVSLEDDEYEHNNYRESVFETVDILPNDVIFQFKTNNLPFENRLKLYDGDGNEILNRNFNQANTTFRDTLQLNGCYTVEIVDTGNDGLQWWANANQGTGFFRITKSNGQIIKILESDFGGRITYSFAAGSFVTDLAEENIESLDVIVYPNPTTGMIYIDFPEAIEQVEISDINGNKLDVFTSDSNQDMYQYDLSSYHSGVYLLTIKSGNKVGTKRVTVIN